MWPVQNFMWLTCDLCYLFIETHCSRVQGVIPKFCSMYCLPQSQLCILLVWAARPDPRLTETCFEGWGPEICIETGSCSDSSAWQKSGVSCLRTSLRHYFTSSSPVTKEAEWWVQKRDTKRQNSLSLFKPTHLVMGYMKIPMRSWRLSCINNVPEQLN